MDVECKSLLIDIAIQCPACTTSSVNRYCYLLAIHIYTTHLSEMAWYMDNMVSDPFNESRIGSDIILQSGLDLTQLYKTSLW